MWETLLGVGSSLLGGLMGSSASSDAADTAADAARQAAQIQAQSAREALDFQREMWGDQLGMYREGIARQQPYYGTGTNALAQLSSLYDLYDPSNFRMQDAEALARIGDIVPVGGGGGGSGGIPSPGGFTASGVPDEQTLAWARAIQKANAPIVGRKDITLDDYGEGSLSTSYQYGPRGNTIYPTRGAAVAAQNTQRSSGGGGGAGGYAFGGKTYSSLAAAEAARQRAIDNTWSDPTFDPTGMAGFYAGPEHTLAQNALEVAMERGTGALDRAAAASGGILSGAHAKAMSDYAQGTNQQYIQGAYSDYANRLAQMAGIGQSSSNSLLQANQNLAGLAGNYANRAGNLMMGAGNAAAQGMLDAGQSMAAGQMGSAGAWQNAFGNLGQFAGMGGFSGLFGGGATPSAAPVGSTPSWWGDSGTPFGLF